jgi:hypothetical protein
MAGPRPCVRATGLPDVTTVPGATVVDGCASEVR